MKNIVKLSFVFVLVFLFSGCVMSDITAPLSNIASSDPNEKYPGYKHYKKYIDKYWDCDNKYRKKHVLDDAGKRACLNEVRESEDEFTNMMDECHAAIGDEYKLRCYYYALALITARYNSSSKPYPEDKRHETLFNIFSCDDKIYNEISGSEMADRCGEAAIVAGEMLKNENLGTKIWNYFCELKNGSIRLNKQDYTNFCKKQTTIKQRIAFYKTYNNSAKYAAMDADYEKRSRLAKKRDCVVLNPEIIKKGDKGLNIPKLSVEDLKNSWSCLSDCVNKEPWACAFIGIAYGKNYAEAEKYFDLSCKYGDYYSCLYMEQYYFYQPMKEVVVGVRERCETIPDFWGIPYNSCNSSNITDQVPGDPITLTGRTPNKTKAEQYRDRAVDMYNKRCAGKDQCDLIYKPNKFRLGEMSDYHYTHDYKLRLRAFDKRK